MTEPGKKQVLFPYRDMPTAEKDAFRKIGGPDKAFTFLVRGFKTAEWRKRTDASARARDAAEDAAFDAGASAAKPRKERDQ